MLAEISTDLVLRGHAGHDGSRIAFSDLSGDQGPDRARDASWYRALREEMRLWTQDMARL